MRSDTLKILHSLPTALLSGGYISLSVEAVALGSKCLMVESAFLTKYRRPWVIVSFAGTTLKGVIVNDSLGVNLMWRKLCAISRSKGHMPCPILCDYGGPTQYFPFGPE